MSCRRFFVLMFIFFIRRTTFDRVLMRVIRFFRLYAHPFRIIIRSQMFNVLTRTNASPSRGLNDYVVRYIMRPFIMSQQDSRYICRGNGSSTSRYLRRTMDNTRRRVIVHASRSSSRYRSQRSSRVFRLRNVRSNGRRRR